MNLKELLEELIESEGSKDHQTSLPNTRETWERIGRNSSFTELGLDKSELADFLKDWISENDYENI